MSKTVSPARLLVSYILARSNEPLSVPQLRRRVEDATGARPSERTIQRSVRELREADKIKIDHIDTVRRYEWPNDDEYETQ
jgi:Fe2+ or Zn2+ uptake regulation protein